MDKLLSEEKELRSEDDKQSSSERKKKAPVVTAIEARLSAVQKLRVSSGRLVGSTTGGGGEEPMTITQYFPTNQSKKKGWYDKR